MSFLPCEAVRKISICLIFEIAPREAKFSQKLNRTLEETAELIALLGLVRQFAQLFPQVCGKLKGHSSGYFTCTALYNIISVILFLYC